MPGELTGPPTLTTLPHAKGMKLELEESEVGESGDDVTEDAGPEEDKEGGISSRMAAVEVKDLDRDESLELEDQLMVMLNEDKTGTV